MQTIRSITSTPDEKAYAYALIDAPIRTDKAVASPGEARLTYIRRFKAKKILNEAPSASSTHAASTPSRHTTEATSSTDSSHPWETNDSKSASQQTQKHKRLHNSRQTSLDHIDRTN
jgi:hypothetical protein